MIIKNSLRHFLSQFFVTFFYLLKTPPKNPFFTRARKNIPISSRLRTRTRALHSVPGVWGLRDVIRMECENPAFRLVHLYHMTLILDSDWSALYCLYITTAHG